MTEPTASGDDAAVAAADGAAATPALNGAPPSAGVAPADAAAVADASPPEHEASAGTRLARARTAQGLSLEDVARQLKFAPRQIEALEADRHEVLPGAAAVRGMVRSYARLLRIDAAPLLETLADRLAVPDADRLAARYGEPVPFSDGARRSTFIYAALSFAVLAVAALVLFQWRQPPPNAAQMSFVPAARAPLETSRAPLETARAPLDASPAHAQSEAVRTEVASAGPSPVPTRAVAAPAQGATPAPDGMRETTQRSAPEAAPTVAAGAHRIALRFERDSWVEVRDGSGRILMSKVNTADSEAVLTGEPPFSLVIGNAQYVRLTFDSKAVDLEPHIKVAVARLTLP